MPTVHGKYGTTIHVPDDMSEDETLSILEQEEKHNFDTVVSPKITAYNDAVTKGKSADEKNRLLADLGSVAPELAKTGKKDAGFLGIDNLVRGVGRIGDALTGKDDAGQAVGDFAGGAVDALGATGRGIARFGGQLTEDALVNAPVALLSGHSIDEARAQGDEQKARQWGGNLLGEAVGMGKVANALKAATGAGAGFQAAGSVGLMSAGDKAEGVLSGEIDPLKAAGEVAQDALLAGVGGKAVEAITPHVVKAIAPAARAVGNIGARIAAPIENALGNSQAENILKSLKIEKDGPLDAGTLQRIATRMGVDGKTLGSAVDEFTRANKVQPSLLEVADPDTMRRYAILARERDASMGSVFRNAEEQGLKSLPGEVANAVEQTGPSVSGVETVRNIENKAAQDAGKVSNQSADELAAATRSAEDEVIAQNDEFARASETEKSVGRSTKGETKRAADIEDDITKWGTKAMRESGLAKQKIELGPEDFKSAIPKDTFIDVLNARLKAIPEDQRGRIINVVTDLTEGRSAKISLDDVDVIRRAFNKMSDTPGLAELKKAAKSLVDKAGDDVTAYKAFLSDYSKMSQTAEDMKTVWGDLGNAPDAMVLAERLLSPVNRAEIVRVMGEDGRALVGRIEAGVEGIRGHAAALRNIQAEQRGATRIVRDSLENTKVQIRNSADKQADAIRKALSVDKEAVRAAQSILNKGSREFTDTIQGASEDLPLGDIARSSIADAARNSSASAVRTVGSMSDAATAERVAKVAGKDTADTIEAIGRTRSKSVQNLSAAAPRDNFRPAGIGAEISGALDAAAALAGRPGPGYAAKMSKGILGQMKKFGMKHDSAIKLANAVARRDASAMRQIIQAATRDPAERAAIARAIRDAILAVGGTAHDAASE